MDKLLQELGRLGFEPISLGGHSTRNDLRNGVGSSALVSLLCCTEERLRLLDWAFSRILGPSGAFAPPKGGSESLEARKKRIAQAAQLIGFDCEDGLDVVEGGGLPDKQIDFLMSVLEMVEAATRVDNLREHISGEDTVREVVDFQAMIAMDSPFSPDVLKLAKAKGMMGKPLAISQAQQLLSEVHASKQLTHTQLNSLYDPYFNPLKDVKPVALGTGTGTGTGPSTEGGEELLGTQLRKYVQQSAAVAERFVKVLEEWLARSPATSAPAATAAAGAAANEPQQLGSLAAATERKHREMMEVLKSLRAIQSLAPDLLEASQDMSSSGIGAQSIAIEDGECSAAEWIQQVSQLSGRLQRFEEELNADMATFHS